MKINMNPLFFRYIYLNSYQYFIWMLTLWRNKYLWCMTFKVWEGLIKPFLLKGFVILLCFTIKTVWPNNNIDLRPYGQLLSLFIILSVRLHKISIHLSISIILSIHLSISIILSIHLSIYIHPSISIILSIHPSISIILSIHLSVSLRINKSLNLSCYLSIIVLLSFQWCLIKCRW